MMVVLKQSKSNPTSKCKSPDYTTKKMNSGTPSTELNDMLTDFANYVDSFYGVNDPLYPMINQETKQPLSKEDIYAATYHYLSRCSDKRVTNCTWGDGDSLDRERVRDILLDEYNYKFVGE